MESNQFAVAGYGCECIGVNRLRPCGRRSPAAYPDAHLDVAPEVENTARIETYLERCMMTAESPDQDRVVVSSRVVRAVSPGL